MPVIIQSRLIVSKHHYLYNGNILSKHTVTKLKLCIYTCVYAILVCHKDECESEASGLSIASEVSKCCSMEVDESKVIFRMAMGVGQPCPLPKEGKIALANKRMNFKS